MLRYGNIKLSARLLILLSALSLASCIRLSAPLSDPDKAKPDRDLLGVWSASENGSKGPAYPFLFVGDSGQRHVPPGIMKMIQVDSDKQNNVIAKEPLYFFTTSLGNSRYANLLDGVAADREKFPTWNKRNIKEYLLIKYQVEHDKLMVWLPDSRAAEALIQAGKIKGTVQEQGLVKLKIVTVTDAASFSQFLGNGGDKVLFPDKGELIYSRVK